MSDLLSRLKDFTVRFARETEEQAKVRRNNLINQAYVHISALEAENADLRSGEYLARVVEERDRMRKALEQISRVAGNIPDEILCSATGANDARYRGGLVCNTRDVARAALTQGGGNE